MEAQVSRPGHDICGHRRNDASSMNLLSDRNDRVLVIDDNPAIHDDFRKILNPIHKRAAELAAAEAVLFDEPSESGRRLNFEITSAFQGKDGFEKVQKAVAVGEPFAIAFVDVRMPPGWDGVETVSRIWKIDPDLQVVICTAYSDYSWDEIDRAIGRSDNLVILKKPFDNIEVLQLAHALTKKWCLTQQANCRLYDLEEMVRTRTAELEAANRSLESEVEERKRTEEALRGSEELFSRAFRASPIPMAVLTLEEDRYVDVNHRFLDMTGFSREEVIGHTPLELRLWIDLQARERMLRLLQSAESVTNFECKLRTKALDIRETLVSLVLFSLKSRPHVLAITQDISERIHLENQLRHAQKMEAVGKLAAGVAHDFNNILTVIQGYTSLGLNTKELDSEIKDSFLEILSAAERAATLTQQLLAFSRKQLMQLRALDLNLLIENLASMLDRLIGDDIQLRIKSHPLLPPVVADSGSIEQVVMNLVLNARDAMLKGGQLLIETVPFDVDDSYTNQNPEATIGRFVCLSIADSGCGMDNTVLSRVFEPFFTTKEFGKGTGMGLAMVYGIVKQHEGWIEVSSKLNHGSTFRIFLPAGDSGSVESAVPSTRSESALSSGERILVVEDEKGILELARRVLHRNGYQIHTAPDGVQALQVWSSLKGEFDLLLTDVVMPGGVSGKELAERLQAEKSDLKVVFTSGYSVNVLGTDVDLVEGLNFLQKPYRAEVLAQTVRNRLDSK